MDPILEIFLRTGCLGPIRPGVSEQEVRAVLGPPDEVAPQSRCNVWIYGSLQVPFLRGSVVAAYVYVEDGQCYLPLGLGLSESRQTLPGTVAELTHCLDAKGIGYCVDEALTFETQVCLLTEGDVGIAFDRGEDDLRKLVIDYRFPSKG